MVFDLLGVLESGGKPDPGLPTDLRRPLAFAAGQSVTIYLRAVERSGVPITLGVGDAMWMTARQATVRPSRRYFDASFTAYTARGPGWFSASIAPATTRGLDGLAGVYDVWMRRSGGTAQDVLVPVSGLRFLAAAADPSAPVEGAGSGRA